MKYYPKSL